MSQRVAVVRFPDGYKMFGMYDTTTGNISNILFTNEEDASAHLDCGSSRLLINDPTLDAEDVDILPYLLNGDETVYFCSRTSRSVGLIIEGLNLDEISTGTN